MRHRATRRFWDGYGQLPSEVRQLADGAFALLKVDPQHPSLRFRRVGRFRSARVGIHYRAPAVEGGDDLVWF